ncbi:MAG: FAD-dependent oxidoreductase [Clostridia bacterium]|nr:FAD-dependent oxidoreductase [Clostridia bacterium]
MFDTAIIGTGPAGLSAAISLKMRGKDVVWFGSMEMSPKVERSEKIANYPGVGIVGGKELNESFRAHAKALELEPVDKMVTGITKLRDRYVLLAENDMFEAKTVLLAIGSVAAKGFPGEAEYLGHGVSYCATCDGMFYKGKTIAVFCGAKRFEHEVRYLADIAEKVYLFAAYPDCGIELPNVELMTAKIKAVNGEKRISTLSLTDGAELPVNGLFCLRNAVAPTALLKNLELDGPHIAVDRKQATNLPGCFAAGDCTGLPYQIAKAVGEGNVAAHTILDYIAEQEETK